MTDRKGLAQALEMVGSVFAIDGMAQLAEKAQQAAADGKPQAAVLGIAYQMEALIIQKAPQLADQLVAWHTGKTADEVDQMENAEYGAQLRDTVVADLCGFFGLSPRTDGTK